MRKELAIGICFCIAGMLTVCFFGYTYFTTYGFLNAYHMQAFAGAKLEVPALLGNIIWERGKLFLIICLVAYTPLKKVAPLVLRCGICFTAGVFLAASMLNMGFRGVVFFVVSLFPHCLFYLMVLLLIFGVDTHSFYNRKNPVVKRVIYYGVVGIVFLIGCISEVMISVPLLQRVIRLICT